MLSRTSAKKNGRGISPEFWLLLILLVSLLVLVRFVLYTPITGDASNLDAKAVLDYRSNLLSVILTAFGAWIGAGAAYFFGRENVREAYEGIRSLQQPSLVERMQDVKIKEIPPRVLEWTVGLNATLGSIVETLKNKPDFWFIPILEPDEKIKTVIEEEAIWRYYQDQVEKEGKADPTATLVTIHEKIIEKNVALVRELLQRVINIMEYCEKKGVAR